MKFSFITQGFYSEQIDYGNSIPNDAVTITDEEYIILFEGVNSGKVAFPVNGTPTLSDTRPDNYHSWDQISNTWIQTEEALQQKETDEKERLINAASSEITRATTQIAILSDKIELDDYDDGETAESVKKLLTAWKKYRIACNSVVNGNSTSLPDAP
ncbi:tail fiber assembly protein [Lonsdalea quercina]|uniref:tail fiber assembly protein n=1 Tax=Lonsdalea quercina TaxID=71657 RepID=UPI003976EB94